MIEASLIKARKSRKQVKNTKASRPGRANQNINQTSNQVVPFLLGALRLFSRLFSSKHSASQDAFILFDVIGCAPVAALLGTAVELRNVLSLSNG